MKHHQTRKMLLSVSDLALRSSEFKCRNITNKTKYFHKVFGVSLDSSTEPLSISCVDDSKRRLIVGRNANTPQSSTEACQSERTHRRKVVYEMDVLIYVKS